MPDIRSIAAAAALGLGALLAPSRTHAEDLWGCEVLLCISNPGGWDEFSQCHPPMDRLWEHLEDGGRWPSCDQAEAAGYDVRHGTRVVEDPGCGPYRVEADGGREYVGYLPDRPVLYGRFVSVYDPLSVMVADNVWRDWTVIELCEAADYADGGWRPDDR